MSWLLTKLMQFSRKYFDFFLGVLIISTTPVYIGCKVIWLFKNFYNILLVCWLLKFIVLNMRVRERETD